MAYPDGVSIAVLTSGTASNFYGADLPFTATVTPLIPGTSHIWHAATGSFLVPEAQSFTAVEGQGLQFTVPLVDQDGWRDDAGNSYKGWAYRVDISVGRGKGKTHKWSKVVAPITGDDLVDVDTVPGQGAGEPIIGQVPAVTSVNGQTGAVTVGGEGSISLTEIQPGVYVFEVA